MGEGPSDDEVHRIHDRFLIEVVEALRLCPFARRSREHGRVQRPLLRCDGEGPGPQHAARVLAETARAHPDAEIILLTFIGEHPRMTTPQRLDDYVKEVREVYGAAVHGADEFMPPSQPSPRARGEELGAPRPFFMVGFHRDGGQVAGGDAPPRLTPDSLVPLLRRTPDPVIQCVDVATLERVRAQAQQAAHERMVAELTAADPALRLIAERSVSADSELSADIARANYAAVAHGEGRDELERAIADIIAERDALQ